MLLYRILLIGMVLVLGDGVWESSYCVAQASNSNMVVKELLCEYAVNPLGIDTVSPRFSWLLESDQRDQRQTTYQVLVASDVDKLNNNIGDKWNSGKVISDKSVNVLYTGKTLTSGEKCYWKVQVWDKDGKASRWSKPATFEMGLLKESDWQGKWIAMGGPRSSIRYVERKMFGWAVPMEVHPEEVGVAVGAETYVKGKFGQALNLDCNEQCVKISHYESLKPAVQITISAWIKPVGIGSLWQHIYRKEDGKARHVFAIGDYPDDVSGLWLGLGIAGSYIEKGAAIDTVVLTDGNWHLAAATYDGSHIKIFFDGVEIGSWNQTGALDTSGSRPGYIGSWNGTDGYFKGGIDDVRIYNRALSPTEIKSLADGNKLESALIGWWKLDGDASNSVEGQNGVEQLQGPKAGAVSPLLRKEFEITKSIRHGRVYISGLGWYELYINGRKVGDHVLDPATTDYDKRILYVTYDVTDFLKMGTNAIGVMLGNGYFSEPGIWRYGRDEPQLLMQMNIEYTDGRTESFVTDQTWKASSGPITRNDIWGGETYDARLEKKGWANSGYDDSEWRRVIIKDSPGGKMVSQLMPPIRVIETLTPVKLTQPKPGVYVYDMGQLFGGWVRLYVKGPGGTKVAIMFSEFPIDKETGLVDKSKYPPPMATDYYILKGDPQGEIYEPRFTFHPVRCVQIEGYPGVPTINDVEGRIVHSSTDLSGRFHCSNSLINKIHQNAYWTVKGLRYGMPLGCLYREHYPFLEPGETPSNAYSRQYMPLYWAKHLDDVKYAQFENGWIPVVVPNLYTIRPGDPAWAGNYPIIVWYLYQYYTDERILQEHYDPIKRWIDHLTSRADNYFITDGRWGDHMLPGPEPGKGQFISSETPRSLCWTGHYYRNALVLSQIAKILGKSNDAKHYAELAKNIKVAFNHKWLNQESNQYATGSQTSNLFALALDIVPRENVEGVVKNVVKSIKEEYKGHLHVGIIGATSMMEVLVKHGQGEVMYELVTKTTYPGWGYMVAQGATTIWESWSGRPYGPWHADIMTMLTMIEEFFYNDLAGIRGPDYYGSDFMTPGFRQIEIKPQVLGDLTFASGSIRTVRGMVSSSWKRTEDSFTLEVAIPVNSTARVSVPKIGFTKVIVTEGDEIVWKDNRFVKGVSGITCGAEADDYVTFDVGSGSYRFQLKGRN